MHRGATLKQVIRILKHFTEEIGPLTGRHFLHKKSVSYRYDKCFILGDETGEDIEKLPPANIWPPKLSEI